jgi:DNA-binding PadR family transcriptional regulator
MVSKVDLLVLGLLMDRPMHGYEISQVIGKEEIRGWLSVSITSIYYALNKLKKNGSIMETVHTSETSPERTVYHITDSGRQVFFGLMEKSLASSDRPYLDFDLAVYFINRLPQTSVTTLLAKRRKFLQEWLDSLLVSLESARELSNNSPGLAILEHSDAFLRMEVEWLDHVVTELGAESEPPALGAVERGRLMSLSGHLSSMHLPDVLKFVAAGALTGTLWLRRDLTAHLLSFRDGRPCRVALRQDGRAVLDPEEVFRSLRLIFRWESGQVTFEQTRILPEDGIAVACSVDQIVLEGAREVDNWGAIRRIVPSESTVFERSPGGRLTSLVLSDQERLLLEAMDGASDVAKIAAVSGMSLFEASRVVYTLSALGGLRTVDVDKVRTRRAFRHLSESLTAAVKTLAGAKTAEVCEQAANAAYRPGDIRILRGKVVDESDPEQEPTQAAQAYANFLRVQVDVIGERMGRNFVRQTMERIVREATPEMQEATSRHGFARAPEGAKGE